MSSDFSDDGPAPVAATGFESVAFVLVDSLIHHLVEKGLLTKNDALSVVQTAAEIVAGRSHEMDGGNDATEAASAMLKRIYLSFEALSERTARPALDGDNIHVLRAPVHGERPRFPSDEN